jgi:predicted DNA-binding transcriptional regulator AlpA
MQNQEPTPPVGRVLYVRDVAERFNMTPDAVRLAVRRHSRAIPQPSLMLGQRHGWIDADVDEFIRSRTRLAVHYSSRNAEHYTPQRVIDGFRALWDTLHLDPCAETPAPGRAQTIPAQVHFRQEDDGLAHEWWGNVFVNPPYGRQIKAWVEKAQHEITRAQVKSIAMLLPARTDTAWFQALQAWPRVFFHGRLTFGGNSDPAPFPSMLVLLNSDVRGGVVRLREAYGNIGDVYLSSAAVSWLEFGIKGGQP